MKLFRSKAKKNAKTSIEIQEKEQFNYIIKMAKAILFSDSPNRIYDYIYTLGKSKQFELIVDCIKRDFVPHEQHISNLEELFLSDNENDYRFIKSDDSGNMTNLFWQSDGSPINEMKINPQSTLIFTFPFYQSRLKDAFVTIGRTSGVPWKHDFSNHVIRYIRPINIGVVTNGNHSMAMNIIANESDVYVKEILDLSPVLDEVYTDGNYFKKVTDDTIVAKSSSVEFAAIFEIGRLISNTKHADEGCVIKTN